MTDTNARYKICTVNTWERQLDGRSGRSLRWGHIYLRKIYMLYQEVVRVSGFRVVVAIYDGFMRKAATAAIAHHLPVNHPMDSIAAGLRSRF